jgi:hypothetical protein
MADGAPGGRRLLHAVLVLHLVAWVVTFVLSGRHTAAAGLVCQVPLWVVVPIWLVREIERGRTAAQVLFALLLAFLTVGNAMAAAAWARLPEHEGRDSVLFAASVVLAVGYAVGAAVVGCSPAVGRVVAAGRAARVPGRGNRPAEPPAAADPARDSGSGTP